MCCPLWLKRRKAAVANDCSGVVASCVAVGRGSFDSAIQERRSANASGTVPSVVAMIVGVLRCCIYLEHQVAQEDGWLANGWKARVERDSWGRLAESNSLHFRAREVARL